MRPVKATHADFDPLYRLLTVTPRYTSYSSLIGLGFGVYVGLSEQVFLRGKADWPSRLMPWEPSVSASA